MLRDYGGYSRETNHLDIEFSNEESDIPGATYTEHLTTYFDKQTGALVQLEDTHTYHNPDITFAVTWKLVSQNAWTGAENDQVLTLPVIIAALVVALVIAVLAGLVYLRKRSNKKE